MGTDPYEFIQSIGQVYNAVYDFQLLSQYLLLHYVRGRSNITVGREYLIFSFEISTKQLKRQLYGKLSQNENFAFTLYMGTVLILFIKTFPFYPATLLSSAKMSREYCHSVR